jgi:fructose-bisphosphate aldolase class I
MEACAEASEMVLRAVFAQLAARGLKLEAVILKPSMVLPGKACLMAKTATQVAGATIRCLLNAVPTPVAGIAFLSGGQSPEAASARLNAMNTGHDRHLPWPLSFSFSRAIQQPALEMWMGQDAHGLAAQRMLFHRARCNQAARKGDYTEAMEKS